MAFCISPGEQVSSHCPREITRYSDREDCSVIRIWPAGYATIQSSKSTSKSTTYWLLQAKTAPADLACLLLAVQKLDLSIADRRLCFVCFDEAQEMQSSETISAFTTGP